MVSTIPASLNPFSLKTQLSQTPHAFLRPCNRLWSNEGGHCFHTPAL